MLSRPLLPSHDYYNHMNDRSGVQLIAEVKVRSPFGYTSTRSWGELFEIACSIGDVVSIHTDIRWSGSFELLQWARRQTTKPILAKGIHSTDLSVTKAVEAGADYVLVVGRLPKVYIDRCFIEPLRLDELHSIPIGTKVVWNSRDLATGNLKEETFEEARSIWSGWLCQASNLKSVTDIKPGANAILVGTHIEGFI